MLVQYTRQFWFPTGALAANMPAAVFPEFSNVLAPLWADAAGTVPLPNPLNTDLLGNLTFFAESGNYWIHIDAETFFAVVGMGQEQADLSTGVASGGFMRVNAGDPTAVDIFPYDGYIVSFLANDETEPVITRVKSSAIQTVPLDAGGLARPVTWWLVDSANTIVQQGTRPTQAQRRSHVVLGVTGFASGAISVVQPIADSLADPVSQLGDLMDALGAFNVSGNVLTPNADLTFNHSSGQVFTRGFNRFDMAGNLTADPHVNTTQAQAPALFRHVTRSTTTFGGPIATVDVGNYDVGGVVTPIPGGANTATNFRIWLSPTPTAAEQMLLQYGQTTYPSLMDAVAALGTGVFEPNVVAVNTQMVLLGYLSVIKSATSLADPVQALLTQAPKFATV